MTPSQRRTVVNVTAAVVVAVAVGLLVSWLRATAPTTSTEQFTVAAADVEPGEVLLCDDLIDGDRDDLPVPGRATSGEILGCPVAFDGLIVSYAGEVVGDVLRRDGGSWLLVNDDAYALVTGPLGATGTPSGTNSGLAVWVPSPLDRQVDQAGRAQLRGDVIEVVGEVRRADPQDGGGLTVRADELEVIAEAVEVDVPVHWRQVWVAVGLAAVAIAVAVRDRRRSE